MSNTPPKEAIELITRLHESFGSTEPSEQQKALLQSIEDKVHQSGQAPFDPTLFESLELLAEDAKDEHPHVATVVQEVLRILGNMGI